MATVPPADGGRELVLITGGTSGFGYGAAALYLHRGCDVIVTSRSASSADEAAERLAAGNAAVRARVHPMALDLADLRSVVAFVSAYKAAFGTSRRLAKLILNAGVAKLVRELSPQGLELTYATNHFGGAALFNLLAAEGVLAQDRPCRVVAVGSLARAAANVRVGITDLSGQAEPFSSATMYGNSKLMNHLWSFQVDKRYRSIGVTSNSLHPGSGLFTGLGRTDASALLRYTLVPLLALLSPLMWVVGFAQTWHDGGVAEAAAADDASSPHYFYRHIKSAQVPPEMGDEALQEWLWAETQRLLREAAAKHGLPATIAAA